LKIERIADFPGSRIVIFDRTGNIVYEATDYNNEDIRFDGSVNNGASEDLRSGTYYYVIDVGLREKLSGYIQLVKN
jgi:gliding motility-associated-like protein